MMKSKRAASNYTPIDAVFAILFGVVAGLAIGSVLMILIGF